MITNKKFVNYVNKLKKDSLCLSLILIGNVVFFSLAGFPKVGNIKPLRNSNW